MAASVLTGKGLRSGSSKQMPCSVPEGEGTTDCPWIFPLSLKFWVLLGARPQSFLFLLYILFQ